MKNLGILIIDKNGTIKTLCVKEYNESDLYKKCGFTKPDGFIKQTEWTKIIDNVSYSICLYAKKIGKANYENKYDFPPPIDKELFFGSCALVCKKNKSEYISLTIPIWTKIYEKLMGGFEDLSKTSKEDEEEEDELDKIPANKKTKSGYLKDGFIVDGDTGSDSDLDDSDDTEQTEEEEEDEEEEVHVCKKMKTKKKAFKITENNQDDFPIDITTELEEEAFSDC
jgi:hypothetical protein